MESKAVFLSSIDETEISKKVTPEFWLLYQQSVLLSLKEQDIINEIQYQLCMDALTL